MNHIYTYRPMKLADRKWLIERRRQDGTWHPLGGWYSSERAAAIQIAGWMEYRKEGTTPLAPADTPEQIARASISAYREYVERYGQSPDEATEAAVHEVLEGLAVDVAAVRAEMAAHPGPMPKEMEGWAL